MAQPAEQRLLELRELRAADVLLSRGAGVISDLIVAADGGHYSHAALWSGMGVIEASSAGITMSEPDGEYAVYRRRELDEDSTSIVVDSATREIGGAYAYAEIVMLGLLFNLGVRVRGAWLERALEQIGGRRALKLKHWLNEHAGQTRVCTELVASAFFQTPNRRFALRIVPVSDRVKPGEPTSQVAGQATATVGTGVAANDAELADALEAKAACAELLAKDPQTRKLFVQSIAISHADGSVLGVVTPADLEHSPSLEFIGRFCAK